VVAAVLLAGLVIGGDVLGREAGLVSGLAPRPAGLPRGLVVRAVVAMADARGLAAAGVIALGGATAMLASSAAMASRLYRRREF
jgi:hypothetical protein